MSKEKLSVSRMNCWNTCQLKHLYAYDYGVRRAMDGDALVFGNAFHKAMEVRAKGADSQQAFEAACATIPKDWQGEESTFEFFVAKLQAAVWAYFTVWTDDIIAQMEPEIEFTYPIDGSRTFEAAGKIDGIAHLKDGRIALVEHKTTSEPIEEADAAYWKRLRLNFQLCRYVKGAKACGKEIETVIYDVFHKPALKPKDAVKEVDENGIPFVMTKDANGNDVRCIKRDGQPKKSADTAKGEFYYTRPETPEEFGQRLRDDMVARPGFYFQRREVTVTDEQLEAFSLAEQQMARQILSVRADSREAEKKGIPACAAFMQNVSHLTCPYCDYENLCMAGRTIAPGEVPDGFKYTGATPELSN